MGKMMSRVLPDRFATRRRFEKDWNILFEPTFVLIMSKLKRENFT